ncbi:MAG: hypothetical protein BHW64_01855 [Candidatus Melainabacteria bacterium LEY3_CP_29_8]|nr:MAG: hypothetical protein BHW64_01855 [Candidatus Melainabacteria bacterium LEY3_CP_29_8]
MIFEPEEEYRGDIIRIDKLIEFLPAEHWERDENGKIDLNDRRRYEMKQYRELLLSKGFSLNEYSEGKFWELEVREDEKLKQRICNVFGADVELFANGTDIDTLILQCAEDFTKCLFYYDCNSFDVETEDFMKYVSNI